MSLGRHVRGPARRTITAVVLCALLGGCWPTPEPTPVRVRMLYDIGGKGDLGWNDQGYLGLLAAREQTDMSLIEATPLGVEEAAVNFYQWLADPTEGFREVIIAHSSHYAELVEQAQCFFDARRVILFGSGVTDCGAVTAVRYRTFPVAFLAGYAAMKASKTKKLGIIVGATLPPFQELAEGFRAGANYAGAHLNYPAASCDLHFIPPALRGTTDPAEATKWADIYWEKGVDVIFALAGASNFAIIESAKAEEGRYVVGSDSDQARLGAGVVLASVIRRNDLTIARLVEAMWGGRLGAGLEIVEASSGEIELAENPAFASVFEGIADDPDVAAEAAKATQSYVEGTP